MSASCVAGQTTAWDGTPAIFTLKPGPGAAHADTHSCFSEENARVTVHCDRSDGERKLGERSREPMPRVNVGGKLVVAAANILDKGMAGANHPH
jgi:hypothetical protein